MNSFFVGLIFSANSFYSLPQMYIKKEKYSKCEMITDIPIGSVHFRNMSYIDNTTERKSHSVEIYTSLNYATN